jgi:hypothetical protein
MVAAQERFVSDLLEPNEWTPLQGLQRLSAWWRNQARSGGELAQAESFYSYQQIQKAILKGIERLQAKSNSDAVLLYLCETLHHTLRR